MARKKPEKFIRLPEEVKDFILTHYKGVGPKEMTEKVRELFQFEYDTGRMKGFYARYKLNSGVTGYFPKGNVPFNKGMKGWAAPGTEKTRFQKGHRPQTWLPVGTEVTLSKDGYVAVKIAEPNVWELKHRLIWERNFGKIPEGCAVIFKNQDRRDFRPENLMLVTRAELSVMNHMLKFTDDPEINETKVLLSKVILMGRERRGKRVQKAVPERVQLE